MPFVQVTWLPKACRRSPEVRKQVADAILKAMVSVKGAEIVCLLDPYHLEYTRRAAS